MEKIFRPIETLLRRHDYVIVPELGGFVYQYQSAVIRTESIRPPLTTVSFNPLMNVSDGLLAIEFSRMENVSFREASVLVSQEIELLKSTLKKNKKVEFGCLGVLSVNENEKMIFSPTVEKHLIPANFGLKTLHYSPSTADSERKVISFTLPSTKKMVRYAAIGVVAVGLFFAAPKIGDATKNLAYLFPTEIFQQTKKIQVDEPAKPLLIAIPEVETLKVEAAEQIAELKHHVIVSCMATQKDAESLVSTLNKMNFSEAHILPPIKTYRVSIQSFATKNEAIEFMQNLRVDHVRFSDAWVLSENN